MSKCKYVVLVFHNISSSHYETHRKDMNYYENTKFLTSFFL
jgi:hypothetical protein